MRQNSKYSYLELNLCDVRDRILSGQSLSPLEKRVLLPQLGFIRHYYLFNGHQKLITYEGVSIGHTLLFLINQQLHCIYNKPGVKTNKCVWFRGRTIFNKK